MTTEPTWLDETAALMRARESTIRLSEIAENCNVSLAWLSKLQNGRLTDASATKLQRVNAWLKEKAETTKR